MRCVVYDPQDLEALTVIDVPQDFIRGLERGERGSFLRFPVREPLHFTPFEPLDALATIRCAEVRMERFHYGRVSTWVAMALNPEICLLMRSELLPGQRRDAQEREREAFLTGLAAAFGIG
jgi:hypothetical protein